MNPGSPLGGNWLALPLMNILPFGSFPRFSATLIRRVCSVVLLAGILPVMPHASAQGLGLAVGGPLDPVQGFPTYYTDNSRTKPSRALELCLTNPTAVPANPGGDLCALTRLIPAGDTSPIVFPTNFPAEIFYSSATAILKLPSGAKGTLILALEGTFFPLTVAPGNQVVFARKRIVFTKGALQAGATYTVTHPFGTETIVAAADGSYKGTIDQGCVGPPCGDFSQVIPTTNVGPFLEWDPKGPGGPPPAGYLGDPNVLSTVIGSPYNTNFFKISGPGVSAQQNLFAIVGKLYTGVVAPPLTVDRTSYTNNANGRSVQVFARSQSDATVTASVGGTTQTLATDGLGYFYKSFPSSVSAGTPVVVTATLPAGGATTGVSPLKDDVIIDSLTYDTGGILTVQAHSSDELANPTLSVSTNDAPRVLISNLSNNALTKTLTVVPASLSVSSSLGGATEQSTKLIAALVPTTLTLTSSKNPSGTNEVIQLTATIATGGGTVNPTGSVTFFDGAANLGTVSGTALVGNTASLSVSFTAVGTHTVTAQFSGDGTYAASATTQPLSQTVKVASSITLTSSTATATAGTPLSLTATVNGSSGSAVPTGTVSFVANGVQIGTASVNANRQAVLSWTPATSGQFTVTAIYGGDLTFSGSTSSGVTISVSAAASPATLTLSSSANPSVAGQGVSLTVVASNGATGTIKVLDGSVTLATLTLPGLAANNQVSLTNLTTLTAGSHNITASYSGDAKFLATTSAILVQVVKTATTTTLNAPSAPTVTVGGRTSTTDLTVTVAPTTVAGGTVKFSGTIGGSTVTLGTLTLGTSNTGVAPASPRQVVFRWTPTTATIKGTWSIVAIYSGTATFASSTSAAQKVSVK